MRSDLKHQQKIYVCSLRVIIVYIHISVENFIKYDLSVHHHYRIHQYVHSSFYRVRLVCTLPTSSTSICPQQLNQERLVFTVSLSCTSICPQQLLQSTICLYSIIIVYIIMSITAFTKYDLSLQYHYRLHQYVHSSFYQVRLVFTVSLSTTSVCPWQFLPNKTRLYGIIIEYINMSIAVFTKYVLSLRYHYRLYQYVHSSFYQVRLVFTISLSTTSTCPQQL